VKERGVWAEEWTWNTASSYRWSEAAVAAAESAQCVTASHHRWRFSSSQTYSSGSNLILCYQM